MNNIRYELRPYNNDDYDFVYNTKKVAYKKYVEEIWGEWNEQAQKIMFVKFIDAYKKDMQIIMLDGKRIGFYHGEDLENNGYEIGNICIIPECQGKGIGTKFLTDRLQEHKSKDIYLRYFKQNPVGNLYKRLGFELLEEMQHHFKMVLKTKTMIKN